jgi:hypothetical protein
MGSRFVVVVVGMDDESPPLKADMRRCLEASARKQQDSKDTGKFADSRAAEKAICCRKILVSLWSVPVSQSEPAPSNRKRSAVNVDTKPGSV